MGAAQPDAVQAACRVLGALAFGDNHMKRHLLSSGVATTLVSQLLRCTPVATASHTTSHAPSPVPAQIPASARVVSAARALQDLVLRSSSGAHSGAEHSEAGSAHEPSSAHSNSQQSPAKKDRFAEYSRTKERKPDSAPVFVPPIPPTALAQAAAMLEAVLDSTSATAMQQLVLSVDTAPLMGVATGVLGAVAKVVSPIDCGKMAWTPSTPASPVSCTGANIACLCGCVAVLFFRWLLQWQL